MRIDYPVSPEEVIEAREQREKDIKQANRRAYIRRRKG